jgi:hypothetical protein
LKKHDQKDALCRFTNTNAPPATSALKKSRSSPTQQRPRRSVSALDARRFDPGPRGTFNPGEVLKVVFAATPIRCILRIRNAIGETES